ncbi:MAG: multicopper oxidase domain-containing protein, partial [Gemmatimonadetes bacterium]|nr:multicopper oxidase domain-containing protein [Gemmatimonadota bacterium]
MSKLNRREALKRGAMGVAGLAAAARALSGSEPTTPGRAHHPEAAGAVGEVTRASIDPLAFLEAFDYGSVERLPSGQVRRTYELYTVDQEIEVAPGVFFPAWTYNAQVPGPTLRATEGDLVRVNFRNLGTHPHTIHFHGIHPANMDGVFE